MEENKMKTDEQLALNYMAGDNKAFDEILCRYKDQIFSTIYNRLNDKSAVDDIFQDIFIRIIVSLREGRYSTKGQFKFWVARITHNALIDYHRKNKLSVTDVNEENDLNSLKGQDVIDICEEEKMVKIQNLNDAVKLMNHLPSSQREVVYMKYFENKSFKEIAEQTNVSINTSLGRMRYAIINMRRMAKEHKVL